MKVIAVFTMPGGIMGAEDAWIEGDDKEDVLEKARQSCPAGRYLSRLVADDRRTTVWEESKGWIPLQEPNDKVD